MADPIVDIPHAGPWIVSGSDRSYDWIGPNSTMPGAGRMFAAFDRFFPFTRMIRGLRRLFGLGGDDMDGPQTLEVKGCGIEIIARGMTLRHDGGNRYVGERDIEGTKHRMELTVLSETEMTERWTFGVGGDAFDGISAEDKAKAAAAGVDLSGLASGLTMESDAPMTWRYTGDPTDYASVLEGCCEAVWLVWLKQRTYADGYGDPDLIAQAVAEGWDYEHLTSVVWLRGKAVQAVAAAEPSLAGVYDALWPLIERTAKAHADGTPVYETAGVTDPSGNITIEVESGPVDMRSILEHELVHVRQIEEFHESWSKDSGYDTPEEAWAAAVNDPDFAGPMEYEAYQGGMGVLEDWLRDNCPTYAARLPPGL